MSERRDLKKVVHEIKRKTRLLVFSSQEKPALSWKVSAVKTLVRISLFCFIKNQVS